MRLLLLNEGVVTEVINQDSSIVDKQEHQYDTLILDDNELFIVGEKYSIEEYNTRYFNSLSTEEQVVETRKKMMVDGKEKADICFATLGFKNKADKIVKELGSSKLKKAWFNPSVPYTRLCDEISEMQNLVGITDEQMDAMFNIGIVLDMNDIQGTTTPEQYAIIDTYIQVEEKKQFLADTDFKFTSDYDQDTTEVEALRAEARAFVRENEVI